MKDSVIHKSEGPNYCSLEDSCLAAIKRMIAKADTYQKQNKKARKATKNLKSKTCRWDGNQEYKFIENNTVELKFCLHN